MAWCCQATSHYLSQWWPRSLSPYGVTGPQQCSKLLPVRLPEADNFGGGPGTFLKIFFNFMFMIWDSRQEDWQLFLLSFENWPQWVNSSIAPSINIFMSSYSSLDTAVLQARVLSWISRITIGNFPHMWWVQCYNVSPNRVLASVRTHPKISARALGRFFRPKIERTLAFLDQCFL